MRCLNRRPRNENFPCILGETAEVIEMKNALVVVVVVALFVTLPMFAAVQYEFFQKSSSDTEAMPSTDMSARAIIEGDKSRIDVIGGNTYPPGTYVITTDGSRRVFFVDPTMKT
ncbi:MAG TPA: hypothetical protein VMU84_14975, partial [Thermoanaerobaculia bacterium]|nr:hypothetical protein [Thermoanaerobaculia bacterium]